MIIDISPLVSTNIAVWPGDVSFSQSLQCEIKKGSNIDLSSLTSTVHVGAHADAPSHYSLEGDSIDQVSLDAYWGPCHVVHTNDSPLITKSACEKAVTAGAERILFRTNSFPDPNNFNEDFTAFSAEAIEYMGKNQVKLIGLDTPSIDPFKSKDLPSHHMILKYGIIWILVG